MFGGAIAFNGDLSKWNLDAIPESMGALGNSKYTFCCLSFFFKKNNNCTQHSPFFFIQSFKAVDSLAHYVGVNGRNILVRIMTEILVALDVVLLVHSCPCQI